MALAAVSSVLTVAGCNIPGLSPAASSRPASAGKTVVTGPAKTVQVSGAPQPSPTVGVYVSPSPWNKIILPSTSPGPSPSPANIACVGKHGPGYTVGIDETHTATSATATWWHNGDTQVQSYRIAAVPSPVLTTTTPDPNWITVAPGTGCHQITATLPLVAGETYELWLDVISTSPTYAGRTIDLAVGRTPGFVAK